MPVNDELLNRTVRHAVYLERLKNHEANVIIKYLTDEVLPDLLDSIRKVKRAGLSASGLNESARLIRDIVSKKVNIATTDLTERLLDIAQIESRFEAGTLGQALEKVNISFSAPSIGMLRSAIKKNPFQGKLLDKWYKSLSDDIAEGVHTQLAEGLRIGESVPELTERIRGTAKAAFADGTWATQMRRAEAVTRTAINHASTMARESTYEANSDVIKGVQYVATLDGRTTEICAGLDGQVFEINEGPRPPMHFNCRSTTVPVTKSWKELGIDLKEAPDGTRASMNGQVSEKQTYGEWLKKQPQSVQRKVLGKTKAELFARGKVDIQSFTNDRYKVLTIKQLVAEEGLDTDDIFSLRNQDIA